MKNPLTELTLLPRKKAPQPMLRRLLGHFLVF